MHLRLRKMLKGGKKPSNLHSQGIEVDAASTCALAGFEILNFHNQS